MDTEVGISSAPCQRGAKEDGEAESPVPIPMLWPSEEGTPTP